MYPKAPTLSTANTVLLLPLFKKVVLFVEACIRISSVVPPAILFTIEPPPPLAIKVPLIVTSPAKVAVPSLSILNLLVAESFT